MHVEICRVAAKGQAHDARMSCVVYVCAGATSSTVVSNAGFLNTSIFDLHLLTRRLLSRWSLDTAVGSVVNWDEKQDPCHDNK